MNKAIMILFGILVASAIIIHVMPYILVFVLIILGIIISFRKTPDGRSS